MQLAKIVSSIVHNRYRAKVLDTFDVGQPPALNDYGYGQFVQLAADFTAANRLIGIIIDTTLLNTTTLDRHWRPAAETTLEKLFSPDQLPSQGVLLEILVIGSLLQTAAGLSYGDQQPPTITLPVHTLVQTVNEAEMLAFHHNQQQQWQLNYYGYVLQTCPPPAETLLLKIVERLQQHASVGIQRQLRLLRQNLQWQQTWGSARRSS
jgi:hypothetical protein